MDLYDDIFNDQSLQFSPLRLSPSPEPFTSIVDVLQDPLVEETENVGEETVGLINNFAVSEANPSMSAQSPDLIPLPDTLTLVQYPPEVEQLLLCTPHGYMQENLPNIQSDQPFLFDQNMLDAFQEPEVFAIQDQQFLYNPQGSLQGNTNGQLDQQSLFNQNTMNNFQEPNDSSMQDHNSGCNPHVFLQGNANGQLDQQSLFNQNTMNPFQELNDSTMIGIGQQIEEESSGYAHPVMTQSIELPNHLQEQFSLPLSQSYPSNLRYQNGLVDSHSNIYDQQLPPLFQADREDEALVPGMVTEVARTCPLQNQTSVTSPQSQIPTSSTRTCPLQNQISTRDHQVQLPQIPSSSTRDHQVQLPQIPSSSTSRNQGNVQELVNKPSSGVKYPTLKDYAHLFPSTKAFAPIEFNVLWRQQENNPSRFERRHRNGQSRLFERSVSGRRQRNDPSGFEDVESSSAAQRRRTVSPKRNDDLTAVNLGDKRLQNKLYDPLYESLGLKLDPHLRVFFPPKKNGLQVGRGAKENQRRQEPDERPPFTGKRDRRLI
ncbi:PREDICTED: uncharacterized protein LOC106302198 [Brassica oleracea var. oleracea]|uniref:uncharacterized protein LOC106302198 n=1 Tax=Brassica oleracea var. oleracea TaxID=109376 RepID=UPI0006A700D8|nr:PREDICTED: uncharacterized protein LOC106302198 [Brassica oleracea var. oleracea]XP_013594189.1 PREDICTED: uncharacterized protein LOC106302198 [Brassica oleracea var. oleracea]